MCLGFPLPDNHIKCPTLVVIILLLVRRTSGQNLEAFKAMLFPTSRKRWGEKYFHVLFNSSVEF